MHHCKHLALLTLLAPHALAGGVEPQAVSAVASLRIGWDYAQVGESQSVQLLLIDPAPDYFETSQEDASAFLFGGFLGFEFPLQTPYNLRWQTGVAYYQSTSFNTKGVENFFSLPDYGDIEYSYSVENQRALIENKFLWGFTDRFYLYLLGGIGVGFNKASDYSAKSIEEHTPANGLFDSKTTTSLSYSLGFGIEGVLSNHLLMSLGYQYSDLGEYSLGHFNYGDTADTLTLPNLMTHEIVLALSVIF